MEVALSFHREQKIPFPILPGELRLSQLALLEQRLVRGRHPNPCPNPAAEAEDGDLKPEGSQFGGLARDLDRIPSQDHGVSLRFDLTFLFSLNPAAESFRLLAGSGVKLGWLPLHSLLKLKLGILSLEEGGLALGQPYNLGSDRLSQSQPHDLDLRLKLDVPFDGLTRDLAYCSSRGKITPSPERGQPPQAQEGKFLPQKPRPRRSPLNPTDCLVRRYYRWDGDEEMDVICLA